MTHLFPTVLVRLPSLLGLALLFFLLSSLAAVRAVELPGQFYDIGGYRLYMTCMGEGEPTVIFDAGLGGFSLEWLRIQRELAADVRTCAYDRAGYGRSDPGPSPRATSQITEELQRLLQVAGIKPPYILVGHSFGGYNMQYFAKLYPQDTVAVVLVDSSHPDQAERISSVPIRDTSRSSRPQMMTTLVDVTIVGKYPEDVRAQALQALASRKAIVTRQRELANFDFSGTEVQFAGYFPDVPLVVITRGQRVWPHDPLGDAREAQWRSLQEELVQLSPRGRHVIAADSGHMVHLDEPELVAEVIREVVQGTCEPVIRMAQC